MSTEFDTELDADRLTACVRNAACSAFTAIPMRRP
jgi:hypothetical protein